MIGQNQMIERALNQSDSLVVFETESEELRFDFQLSFRLICENLQTAAILRSKDLN